MSKTPRNKVPCCTVTRVSSQDHDCGRGEDGVGRAGGGGNMQETLQSELQKKKKKKKREGKCKNSCSVNKPCWAVSCPQLSLLYGRFETRKQRNTSVKLAANPSCH